MVKTPLTPELLKELGFVDKGKSIFKGYSGMNFWVKNAVCLFYNVPLSKYDINYLVGVGEIIEGEYTAIGIRWINNLEDLTTFYEITKQKKIREPI